MLDEILRLLRRPGARERMGHLPTAQLRLHTRKFPLAGRLRSRLPERTHRALPLRRLSAEALRPGGTNLWRPSAGSSLIRERATPDQPPLPTAISPRLRAGRPLDERVEVSGLEGFHEIGVGSDRETTLDVVFTALCRDHDHGDALIGRLALQALQ
jgi:hypothetical protein